MLYRAETPVEGWCAVVWASPFAPPDAATGADPERYRDYLRALYRHDRGLFIAWARDAAGRDLTLLGDEWLSAVLYDALCRVARAIGLDIGAPLAWQEAD
jgi:hypothetical protein